MNRASRLRSTTDFARVKQEGKLYRHPVLSVGVLRNTRTHNRYGFVVSSTLGGAVVRNRCKRRLRAIVSRMDLETHRGFDIVLIARPKLVRKPFDELQRILGELLMKARVLDGGRFG